MKILINSLPCTKCGKLAFEDFAGSGRWFECDECGHYFDMKEYHAAKLNMKPLRPGYGFKTARED